MRILCAGHSVAHYRQRKMLEYIADEGHKVVLVSPPQVKDEEYSEIRRGSFELRLAQPYPSQIPSFWFIPALHEHVKQFDPDVVFCMQEPWEYFSYHISNIAKAFGKPFAFFTWENLHKYLPQPLRSFDAEVMGNADLGVGGNNDAARILIEKGVRRVESIPQTGLDEELFVPTPNLNYDDREEPLKVLYIGRLVKEKGIEVILQAYDRMQRDAVLRFVGGRGDMGEVIKQHPDFGEGITLEGWKEYRTLPKIYNWADVVVMPSIDTERWREQMGFCVGEALLCHTPVITSLSKSIAELWDNPDVMLVEQGNVDGLAVMLDRMDIHEAKEGRQFVIENYSYSAIGDRYIEVLEDII